MSDSVNSSDQQRNYRRDFSLEEVNAMLGDIESTLSSYKAELQGIDPENMVKTVRGGRVVWITVDEMNEVLTRRRRLTMKKNTPGQVRSNHAVAEEMNGRVDACRQLLDLIRKISPDSAAEIISRGRRLDLVHNRADTLARDIRLLETAIERKRKEDPILQEMEEATLQMMVSLENNNLTEAGRQQSFCDRHVQEFDSKQKRLEPYLRKVEEYRSANLQNKQQVFLFEFELIEFGVTRLLHYIDETTGWKQRDERVDSLENEAKLLRKTILEAQPSFVSFRQCSLAELQKQGDVFDRLDREHLLPWFDRTMHLIEVFQETWPLIGNSDAPPVSEHESDSEDKRSAPRMIFQKRNMES